MSGRGEVKALLLLFMCFLSRFFPVCVLVALFELGAQVRALQGCYFPEVQV